MKTKKGLQLPPDFLAQIAHLSTPESGAYLNLLLAYWERKGPLPDDDEYLARAARATKKSGLRWSVIKPNVMAMFQKRHNCWTHCFVENQILKLYERNTSASNSVKIRWNRQKGKISTPHIEENQTLRSYDSIELNSGIISQDTKENYQNDRSVTSTSNNTLTPSVLGVPSILVATSTASAANGIPSIGIPSKTTKHQHIPQHYLSDSSCFPLTGKTLRILKDGTSKNEGLISSSAGNFQPDFFGTKASKKTTPLPPSTVVASSAADDPETQLFKRGKEVLGPKSGGMIARLLKSRGGNIALARAAIETASTKENPAEYVGAICRNANLSHKEERERAMRRERGEAW